MATTTNYGWTTPDDTALVKDGASAIRSLGTSVDTTTKNLNPSTTLGDIEYRSSTANTNTRLAIGSTGNVLTVAGGVPTWAAPAGGGKVLQVVQATTSSQVLIASTSYTDSGLTASITPSASNSKILVLITQGFQHIRGTYRSGAGYKILRGATTIWDATQSNKMYDWLDTENSGATVIERNGWITINYLDSPATTSSTTYKTQGAAESDANSGKIIFQNNAAQTSSIILMEIGA